MTHYETLGVAPNASVEEIAAAMRRLRKEHHPDREGGSTEKMQALNAAYDVLCDAAKRKAYDSSLPDADRDAMQLLHGVFMAAIDNDAENLVTFARIKLAEIKAQANTVATDSRRAINKLEKRRARVKVKAGTNLVHAIIDRRLESLEGQKAGCADTLLLVERAFKLIGDYVDEPEDAHVYRPQQFGVGQLGSLGFGALFIGSGT